MAVTSPQRSRAGEATIPVIDLGPYLAGVPGALETVAAELRFALEDIGFFISVRA
jgi:isopenicillin N synthase-like dioxygenase